MAEQQQPAAQPTTLAATPKAPTYSVVERFRDKDNFNHIYEAGADVSNADKKRLAEWVKKGLVKKND